MMKLDKLLATLAFAFLALALLAVAITGSAEGYEISIYSAYPPYFWVFLIFSMLCGLSILVRNAFSERKSRWWIAGLIAMLLGNSILLLLPLFRGYITNGFFDPLNQIGLIRDIQLTGHFGAAGTNGENFYPALHILVANTSSVTGLSIELTSQVMPPIFFILYISSIYLLSQAVTKNRGQSLLITAFGSLPSITSLNENLTSFIPRLETFFLLPFILYLFYRARGVSLAAPTYTIAFVIILLSLPFFHPFDGGIFLVLILMCLGISYWIYRTIRKLKPTEPDVGLIDLSRRWLVPVLILSTVWFIWFCNFSMFSNVVRGTALWMETGIGQSESQHYLSLLSRGNITIADTIQMILKREGHHILYFGVSAVTTVAIWWKLLFTKRKSDVPLVIFSFLFIVWLVLMLLSFASSFQLGYTRFISYAVFFSTITNGLSIYWIYKNFRHKILAAVSVTFFLIISLSLSVFNCYGSPFTAGSNQQVCKTDMNGMSWFLEKRDELLISDQITLTQYNYASALLGRQSVSKNIREAYAVEASIPIHFGYDKYANYGSVINEDRYFLSHKLDRIVYTERIPQYKSAWLWSPDDFNRLESDTTVNRLYNSGEFEVFFIRSTTTEGE